MIAIEILGGAFCGTVIAFLAWALILRL